MNNVTNWDTAHIGFSLSELLCNLMRTYYRYCYTDHRFVCTHPTIVGENVRQIILEALFNSVLVLTK